MVKISEKKHRVLCVTLALSIVISFIALMPVNVSAAVYDTSKLTFEEYVIENFKNFETTINALPYAKDFDYDTKAVANEVLRIAKNSPELFHVIIVGSNIFKVSRTYSNKNAEYTVFNVQVKYSMTKSEYTKKKAEFDKAVKKALTVVDSEMTDVEKALVLHDYLALTIEYDLTASKVSSASKADKYPYASTVEGSLITRKSVCEGYTLAYMYLLDQVGINSAIIRSAKINHAWNYVQLDGKWYHVDVTRDDPLFKGVQDQFGFVRHDYFMITDSELVKLEKNSNASKKMTSSSDWDVNGLPAAKSTTYSKAFWKGINTPIQWASGNWYWAEIDKTSPALNLSTLDTKAADYNTTYYKIYHNIVKYNPSSNKKTNIYKLDSTWFTNGSENLKSKTWIKESYATLFIYNDRIYFNTSKQVKSIDLNGKSLKTEISPALNGKYIYGLRLIDGKLQITLKTDASKTDLIKSKTMK